MRFMSVASLGLVVCLSSVGCGTDDKVLEPDGNTSGDGGGANNATGGTNGATNGAGTGNTNTGNTGSSQGSNTSDDNTGGNTGGTPSDPDCDMNGIWVGRQVTQSIALGLEQFASNYYYMELRQDGDEVVVMKNMDCGLKVLGSATVELTPETTRALMAHNDKAGRKGSFKKGTGGTCDFTMERYWNVRGVNEARFAPSPRNNKVSIADLEKANPLPSKAGADGVEDWDNDGKPGTSWQVSGIASGSRATVQRDWIEWFSDAEHQVAAASDFKSDLVVRASFDAQENILESTNPTLNADSMADGSAKHTLTMRFLGRSTSDPRAKALLKSDPYETCRAIQAALPAQKAL